MTTKTKKLRIRGGIRVKPNFENNLIKIINIQEKIIKANKEENDILSNCLKKSYDREDNSKQWAFWYRAWSEYLEKQIQKAINKKDWNEFRFYKKILKLPEIVEHYKKHGSVKENPFEL